MCADLADDFTVADPPSGFAHLVRLEASLKLPVGSKLSHVKSRRVTVQRGELFLVAEFPVGANDPDLPLGTSSRAPAPNAMPSLNAEATIRTRFRKADVVPRSPADGSTLSGSRNSRWGKQAVPEPASDWDLVTQPEPAFEFDQRITW
jgi:hypothetical protein